MIGPGSGPRVLKSILNTIVFKKRFFSFFFFYHRWLDFMCNLAVWAHVDLHLMQLHLHSHPFVTGLHVQIYAYRTFAHDWIKFHKSL